VPAAEVLLQTLEVEVEATATGEDRRAEVDSKVAEEEVPQPSSKLAFLRKFVSNLPIPTNS
jgi:hypothetical protein